MAIQEIKIALAMDASGSRVAVANRPGFDNRACSLQLRVAFLEQVAQGVLHSFAGVASPLFAPLPRRSMTQQTACGILCIR